MAEVEGAATAWGVALPWWTPRGVRLPGRVFGTAGLRLPVLHPGRVVLVRASEVPAEGTGVAGER